MSQNTIIINEFLTFCQNKIDTLDEISIAQICVTNFTDSEIETGKSVLFKAMPGESRNVTRKGEDKNKKNVKDIIKLFKETDPTLQPSFVAKDLSRLPALSFESIDISRFLKDMACMKSELQNLRNEAATKAEMTSLQTTISTDLNNLRSCLKTHRIVSTNEKNKCNLPANVPITADTSSITTTPTRNLSKECSDKRLLCVPAPLVRPSSRSGGQVQVHTPSYRDIIENGSELTASRNNNDEEGFKMVIHKKRKLNSNKCGTAKRPTKILVAELTSAIYISRLNKCTTANDIKEHITERGECCTDVQSLTQHRETEFNSFKITISRSKLPVFLSSDFWPEGIKFRMFREFAPRVDSLDQIREICKCADIIALQETWLWPHDLDFVSQIDPDFDSIAKSSMDTSVGVIRGRPHGGMALLWNKTKFAKVSVIECSSDRLQAVQITVVNDPDNLPEFTNCLAKISSAMEESQVPAAYIIGDFNAHP
ncbi:Mutant cadherin, partial [Operophtera brumata]